MKILYKTPENVFGDEFFHDTFSHMHVAEDGSRWAVFESEYEARHYAGNGMHVWFEPVIVVVALSPSPMDGLIA